jgi:hypothetical protein
VIADQPSLKNYWQEIMSKAYKEAVKVAIKETDLDISVFPNDCPYSFEQLEKEDWLP